MIISDKYIKEEIERERLKRKEQLRDLHHKMNQSIKNAPTDDGREDITKMITILIRCAADVFAILCIAFGAYFVLRYLWS